MASVCQDVKNDGKVVSLTKLDAYRQFISSKDRVVIKYGKHRCRPCEVIAPEFEKLAKTHANTLACASVIFDGPEFYAVADELEIDTVPIFHFFFKGKHMDKLTYQGANSSKLTDNVLSLLNTQ